MTIEEAIYQLQDLRKDRESFVESPDPEDIYNRDIEAISVAISVLKKQGERQWVPVTERLPKRLGEYVLVTDGRSVSMGYIININLGINPWCTSYPITPRSLTYWMPLPEPPKEDAK